MVNTKLLNLLQALGKRISECKKVIVLSLMDSICIRIAQRKTNLSEREVGL